ncbi:MAG TPA: alkaline phosphatase family protein [Anaerolineales bacterium]|nr:alkaline phosphatase family protein [Anaerolineales bacterium]
MIDKVVIIGWDGATWDYMDPLLEQGTLPNLARLLEYGVGLILRSTVPPYTNVAWPALVTGSTPARTGIFDGLRFRPGCYTGLPARRGRSIPIWEWVNHFGKRAGVLNVPTTYPATQLDGYLVTGFDSPRDALDTEYPRGLTAQWAQAGQVYQVLNEETRLMDSQNPHHQRGALEDFTLRWETLTRQQGTHLAWLWQNEPVDLLFSVFSGTDSINHRTRDFARIARVYRAADDALGNLLEVVNDKTLICLVSDHGSTPARRYISLNRILHEQGWLHFQKMITARSFQRLPGFLGKVLGKGWARLPLAMRRLLSAPLLQLDPRFAIAYENIDWSRTKIFGRSSMGPLYINLQGRFPEGCVTSGEYDSLLSQASNILSNLRDPEGNLLFRKIHSGAKLHPGSLEDDIVPDLILEPFDRRDHLITGFPTDPIVRFIPDESEYGTHTPDGVFILAGPGVQCKAYPNHSSVANIQDVVPTLLAAWGLQIPETANGEVLPSLFSHHLEITYAPAKPIRPAPAQDTESDEVLERLRALGYLE